MRKIAVYLTLLVAAACGFALSVEDDPRATRLLKDDDSTYYEALQNAGQLVSSKTSASEFGGKRVRRSLTLMILGIFAAVAGATGVTVAVRTQNDMRKQQEEQRRYLEEHRRQILEEQERRAAEQQREMERHERQMTEAVADLHQVVAQWQRVNTEQQITQQKYDQLQRDITRAEIQLVNDRVTNNENDSIRTQLEQLAQAKLQREIAKNANQALKDQLAQLKNQQEQLEQRIRKLE